MNSRSPEVVPEFPKEPENKYGSSGICEASNEESYYRNPEVPKFRIPEGKKGIVRTRQLCHGRIMVIVFANPKGGVGKSTLALLLALWLLWKGYSVVLIDADGQKSSSDDNAQLKHRVPSARVQSGSFSPLVAGVTLYPQAVRRETGSLPEVRDRGGDVAGVSVGERRPWRDQSDMAARASVSR